MRLSVFYEFCQPTLLDKVKELYPEIYIDKPNKPLNDKYSKIYRTNAKLFFDSSINIDNVLEKLQSIGFIVVDRNPFHMYKEKRTIKVPDPNAHIEYKTCECGQNNIILPVKMIEKTIVVDVKHYLNDRVILDVADI